MANAFVYGSCVSRDLVRLFDKDLTCLEYIARQGWISAASSPEVPLDGTLLTSPFQQRMVDGDFASDALTALAQALPDADLVLMDIIDDRFGVYPLGDSFITPSAEFGASGLRRSLELGQHIPFGSDQHFELWCQAAQKVRECIGDYSWKTFLLAAPFTEFSVDGSAIPPALERPSSLWNEQYRRYYRFAHKLGFNVLTLPDAFAVSTPHHTWGIAPFHYLESSYRWWLEEIKKGLNRSSGLLHVPENLGPT
ncbi:DUF6270 domain-containing protein [Pseudarthrobacter sp. J64]|uniref:DUF6270 domain-containing protein n=1 Tax=Pseudarthrobacter sp. J64 TaxID=3116485 RepID=UPI002E807890|nr:DUF6270 domain-containing protein [Pseudarthrobacter sp. J64]MEE2568483.1 DUF6270 domain-containing protein [Pseudarthrobacter sp. J64]